MILARARQMIAQGQRPVSFSGAGLSAESGVSKFRDAQTGLWATFDPAAKLIGPVGELVPQLLNRD